MSRVTKDQLHRMIAAINNPEGTRDPIWAELGVDPVPPLTDEEHEQIERMQQGDYSGMIP